MKIVLLLSMLLLSLAIQAVAAIDHQDPKMAVWQVPPDTPVVEPYLITETVLAPEPEEDQTVFESRPHIARIVSTSDGGVGDIPRVRLAPV